MELLNIGKVFPRNKFLSGRETSSGNLAKISAFVNLGGNHKPVAKLANDISRSMSYGKLYMYSKYILFGTNSDYVNVTRWLLASVFFFLLLHASPIGTVRRRRRKQTKRFTLGDESHRLSKLPQFFPRQNCHSNSDNISFRDVKTFVLF